MRYNFETLLFDRLSGLATPDYKRRPSLRSEKADALTPVKH